MSTAIYVRISDDREGRGLGVERQLEDCRRLAADGDVREFDDNDIGASRFTKKKRPAYSDMLKLIKDGQISTIVTWRSDRLYRRPRELEDLIELVEGGRLTIRTVTAGEVDFSTSAGRTQARIMAAIDAKASEDTSERVKAQKKQAKAQGRLLGGPRAFGWRSVPVKDSHGMPVIKSDGKVQMQLVQVPAEAKLIRKAVDDLLRGQSLNNLADTWNTANVPTSQGRRDRKSNPTAPDSYKGSWRPQSVRNVMNNRRHRGAIIEAGKFDQLQALLERRATNQHVPRRRSLLTGTLRCSLCGATMVRTGSGRPGRKAWRCPAKGTIRAGDESCGRVSIAADGVELLLVEATLARADDGELAKILRSMGRNGEDRRILRELEALAEQESDLVVEWRKRRMPASAYAKATEALEVERRALNAKLTRMSAGTIIAPYASKAGALRAAWPVMSIDQQREIIAIVLGKVKITPTRKAGVPKFDSKRVQIAKRPAIK